MGTFTIANLKKRLSKKKKAELIQEISTLCQKFPQVKEYFKAQEGDAGDVIRKYKDIIEREFVDGKTRSMFPKARLSVARKAVNDFKKLSKDPDLVADLMLTYVESVSLFCDDFLPDTETLYVASEKMFEDALKLLQQHDLLEKFEPRA